MEKTYDDDEIEIDLLELLGEFRQIGRAHV